MFRNLPNLLTIVRIVLVPFVGVSLWQRHYAQALALVFVAGTTDAVDGWMARRFRWTSRAGAYLDPVADKLLLVTLYVLLAIVGVIPVWLTALVIGRDVFILSMVAAGLAFTTVRDFPPSVWGKISTIVQVSAAVALLANAAMGDPAPSFLTGIVITVTAAATLISGFDYGWRGFLKLRSERIDAGDSRR